MQATVREILAIPRACALCGGIPCRMRTKRVYSFRDMAVRLAVIGSCGMCSQAAHAQSGFTAVYAADTNLLAKSCARTADDGFVITGVYNNAGAVARLAIIRTDASGALQWSRTYGPIPFSGDPVVRVLASGDLLAMTTTYPQRDLIVARLNALGDTSWVRVFDLPSVLCMAWDALEVNNGDLLIASHTHQAVYLTRLDATGNLVWSHGYRGSQVSTATLSQPRIGLRMTPDSALIVAATLAYSNATESECFLMKTDLNGNVAWARFMGGTDEDCLRDVQGTADGGCLAIGYHWITDRHMLAIKVDSLGQTEWARIFMTTSNLNARGLVSTNDGRYVITGDQGTLAPGFMMKIDDQGSLFWSNQYDPQTMFVDVERSGQGAACALTYTGGAHYAAALLVQDTVGASFCTMGPLPVTVTDVVLNVQGTLNIIAGMTPTPRALTLDTLDLTSYILCGSTVVAEPDLHPLLSIQPNPASGSCVVRSSSIDRTCNIELLNASGSVVGSFVISGQGVIDLSHFPAGLYMVRSIKAHGSWAAQRLVIE